MDNRQYVLAIKRNNNDYLPLEWQLTPFYHGEPLSTLEGIDTFTKPISDVDLLVSLIDANMLDPEERFQSFAIIYQEKGRIRELKDGAIFFNYPIVKEDEFIYFILNNMQNKKLINRIYNVCATIHIVDESLEKFKLSINNLEQLQAMHPKAPELALRVFTSIPYDAKRSILIKFSKKVLPEHIKEDDAISHRKVPELEDKIA